MLESALFPASYGALWVLVVFQTIVLLELVRRQSEARILNETPPPAVEPTMLETGSLAPIIEARDVNGQRAVHSREWRGRPTILVFVSPGCRGCQQVADDLGAYRVKIQALLVVICRGSEPDCSEFARGHFPDTTTLLDESGEIADSFYVKGTPAAVLLDPNGRVLRYGFPRGAPRLDLEQLLGASEAPPANSREAATNHSNGLETAQTKL